VVDQIDTTTAVTDEWIAHASDTGAVAKGNTALTCESTADGRAEGTISQNSSDVHRIVGTLTADAALSYGSAGNYTSSSTGGDFIVGGEFTAVALSSGDQIQYTIDLEIA
jgi:hypothetical protein